MFGFKNKNDEFSEWFRDNFINLDMLDWRNSTQIAILEFLDKIKLHDSFILKLNINCAWDNSVVFAVQWAWMQDPENEKKLKQAGNDIKDFKYATKKKIIGKTSFIVFTMPILLVRFNNVKKIEMNEFEELGGAQRDINNVSVVKINATDFETKIVDNYEAKISLIHAEKVNVLCFGKKGNLIKLKL